MTTNCLFNLNLKSLFLSHHQRQVASQGLTVVTASLHSMDNNLSTHLTTLGVLSPHSSLKSLVWKPDRRPSSVWRTLREPTLSESLSGQKMWSSGSVIGERTRTVWMSWSHTSLHMSSLV